MFFFVSSAAAIAAAGYWLQVWRRDLKVTRGAALGAAALLGRCLCFLINGTVHGGWKWVAAETSSPFFKAVLSVAAEGCFRSIQLQVGDFVRW